ncbi:putative Polycomb group protein ASXL3 isoform X2 [Orussus abietinus]|uniref:putative Polycomb group protein ASXL3 isoform X2 n=1 Tax=Orussus abietinus TaxID=222816 RepID=UPI0006261820|nr:putative Polycomb group protein ASXL3 isoform X2 [Orussus abietinus]
MDTDLETAKGEGGGETGPGCSGYSSMVHSKKVIKHALRQQAKRRRKNTTIASGNSRTLPRIVVKPLPPPPPNDPPSLVNNTQHNNTVPEEPAATMREVLASLPGFSLKSGRRRSTKRLSAAAQLEAGLVDLESPASILASTSLRALLNRHTFQGLPPLYQRKLAQLLPAVDRQDAATSGLNNEFFARACLEWRKRLAEGEFTPENQQRLKMEAERDKNKLDPWKLKHFEPIWGEKREPKLRSGLHCAPEPRTGGAVTRASLRLRLEANLESAEHALAMEHPPVIAHPPVMDHPPAREHPPMREHPPVKDHPPVREHLPVMEHAKRRCKTPSPTVAPAVAPTEKVEIEPTPTPTPVVPDVPESTNEGEQVQQAEPSREYEETDRIASEDEARLEEAANLERDRIEMVVDEGTCPGALEAEESPDLPEKPNGEEGHEPSELYQNRIAEMPGEEVSSLLDESPTETVDDEVEEHPEEQSACLPQEEQLQATVPSSDQMMHAHGGETLHVHSEEALHVHGEEALHVHGEQAMQAPSEQVMHAPSEQLLHTPSEQLMHVLTEQMMHTPSEQMLHAQSSQLMHSSGDQLMHTPSDQLLHNPGEQLLHNPGEQMLHNPSEQIMHAPSEQVMHPPGEPMMHSSEPMLHSSGEPMLHSSEEQMMHPGEPMMHSSGEPMMHSSDEQVLHAPSEQGMHNSGEMEMHPTAERVDCATQILREHVPQLIDEGTSHIQEERVSQMADEQVYHMPVNEDNSSMDNTPPGEQVRIAEHMIGEEQSIISTQTESQGAAEHVQEGEPHIPEGMEIDSETLQRIHELEVCGDMRQAYEEISACPEEIIYPILEGMEMGTNVPEEPGPQGVTVQTEDVVQHQEMGAGNEEEALREANNYVCSEMLECNWAVDQTVNNVANISRGPEVYPGAARLGWCDPDVGSISVVSNWPVEQTVNNVANINREELQLPWSLVAAALDNSVAANITVTTQDECGENAAAGANAVTTAHRFVATESSVDTVSCIQLPVVQGGPFHPEALTIGTPVTSCLMKTMQSSQSPPMIAFPQLQSIRFVQTSFHAGAQGLSTPAAALPMQLQQQQPPPPQQQPQQQPQPQPQPQQPQQVGIVRAQEEVPICPGGPVPRNATNNGNANTNNGNVGRGPIPGNVTTALGVQAQSRGQSAIVVQHQAPITAQPRQIVATIQQPGPGPGPGPQPPQYPPVAAPPRSSRSTAQGGQRGSRAGGKEQGGGRSRSSTKEPPGAVNLERSYQICQAVIQSSPNRDQLKAHLKPPPSLLARGDGAFTTAKQGGRTITTVKPQKPQQASQHIKQQQTKPQAVMLRHVFATARQTVPTEITETNPGMAQLGSNGATGLGQYILVQRTGVGDGAPRASSAPPLPPHIAGVGVGVHLVRGRPASAGEGSHQAVTLKPRGASDGRGGGGAEPGAPGVIMGGDPPPPCDCSMRGAMVVCRQCGAFCHDDCIGPQRICATCLIR